MIFLVYLLCTLQTSYQVLPTNTPIKQMSATVAPIAIPSAPKKIVKKVTKTDADRKEMNKVSKNLDAEFARDEEIRSVEDREVVEILNTETEVFPVPTESADAPADADAEKSKKERKPKRKLTLGEMNRINAGVERLIELNMNELLVTLSEIYNFEIDDAKSKLAEKKPVEQPKKTRVPKEPKPDTTNMTEEEKEAIKEAKKAEREAKKAEKLAQLAAEKEAKKAEREAKKAEKLAQLAAEKEAKKAEREAKDVAKIIPWCGKRIDSHCEAIRLHHGLYSQCINQKPVDGQFCSTCVKMINHEKNLSHLPPYGTVTDREAVAPMEYVTPDGKRPLPLANVIDKLKIAIDDVIAEATKHNLSIPEENFEKVIKARGRPKGSSSTASNSDVSDDVVVPNPKKKTEAEKEAAKEAKKLEREARKAEKEAAKKAAKAAEPEAEKKKRGRPAKPKTTDAVGVPTEDLIAKAVASQQNSNVSHEEDEVTISEHEDDEEETKVEIVSIDNVKYYCDAEDNLFDINTKEAVGVWDRETNEIMMFDDEE